MISRRHTLVFNLLRPFFRAYLRVIYNYRAYDCPEPAIGSPALILANHNCNLDPFLLALSFRRPVFFVASDHIFRLGFISSLIRFLVAPIPIVKSQVDLKTLRTIRHIMTAGGLVGLFPEGNRSFSGRTGWISPATGKLARQLKCTLVLYRIDGGYLTTPRWARTRRRGKMQGRAVRIMQPQELAAMEPAQIQQIIEKELYVDAYAEQIRMPLSFKGRHLAENLELALFVCPRCHSLTSLHSHDNLLACTCGLRVKINPLGFFEPQDDWSRRQYDDGKMLDTVAVWDKWQKDYLIDLLAGTDEPVWLKDRSQPIFSDAKQQLVRPKRAVRSDKLARGSLVLYADRLVFQSAVNNWQFNLENISRIIVHGRMTLQFTTSDGQTYEVRTRILRSAYKYVILFNLLGQKRRGEAYGFFGI